MEPFEGDPVGDPFENGFYPVDTSGSNRGGGVQSNDNYEDCVISGNLNAMLSENGNCVLGFSGPVVGDLLNTPKFCDEIDERHSTEPFKSKLENLNQESKFEQLQEEGFAEFEDGSMPDLPQIPNNPSGVVAILSAAAKGNTHLHPNKVMDVATGIIYNGSRMFSRADLYAFALHLRIRDEGNRPVDETYDKVVSSEGIYTMRFIGESTQIPDLSFLIDENDINMDGEFDMAYEYELYQNAFGVELGFLMFLEDNNINNMELYKTDRITMETKKLEIGPDNKLKETKC